MGKHSPRSDQDSHRVSLVAQLEATNSALLLAEIAYHRAWLAIYGSSYEQKITVTDHQAKITQEYEEYKKHLLRRHLLVVQLEDYDALSSTGE